MQNDLYEKIELYLRNEMEEEELRLFEQQLKNDEQLREQVALYKTIDDEMKQRVPGKEEENLKETLTGLNKKYFNQPGKPAKVRQLTTSRRWQLIAAAAVLVFFAGAYLVFFTGKQQDSQTLYNRYAQHPLLSLQRGNNDTSSILQQAIIAYNNKKFDGALTNLSVYLRTDSSDAELVLTKNICLMETGKYETALTGLTNLANDNTVFKYQAIWYKALVYLKQNNKTECKKILATIPADADVYTKAKKLLEYL